MSTIEHSPWTMTVWAPDRVPTAAATDETLATYDDAARERREAWRRVIDHKLIEWGRDPSQLEDDDLIPPTRTAIRAACEAASQLRADGRAAPNRVVPDGDGGIVFERWCGPLSESIEFLRDGEMELVVCLNHTVVSRVVLR